MGAERFDRALRLTVLLGWTLALGSACAGDSNAWPDGSSDTQDVSIGSDVRAYAGQCDDLWPDLLLGVVKVGDRLDSGSIVRPNDYEHIQWQCSDNTGCKALGAVPCGAGDRIVCDVCFDQVCIAARFQSECSVGSDD
jgi:hypothetical protein